MMFQLNELQEQVRTRASALAADMIAPRASDFERDHDIPREVIEALGSAGMLGVNIETEYGGLGAGVVSYAAAMREIAKADGSVAVTMAVTNMVGEVLQAYGTKEQRERHIPELTSGRYFGGAFALSEPGAGSDAGGMTTRAVRDGDDWVINGEKLWITTGDRAGVVVVWARTGGPGPKGISCFLVDGDAAGMTSGKPEEKMGLRGSHTVSLSLEDVRVPASAMLGDEGEGFSIAMMALDGGRIGIASQAVGLGMRALDEALKAALHAPAGSLGGDEQQANQFTLADMATELDAAWLLALRAASMKESGGLFSRQAAMAKVYASEAANRAVRNSAQVLGGEGMLNSPVVTRLFRDARVTQIYEGTSEIQRVVISRSLLAEAAR
ncbi:MAG: acyl-CoA dehydrogenase family protein [Myxococcota bacterium]|nr:acyl-CoA dehydrogenase family protein [Myxococcota bacterium]